MAVCLPHPALNLTYLFALSTTSLLTPKTHAMPSLSYPDSLSDFVLPPSLPSSPSLPPSLSLCSTWLTASRRDCGGNRAAPRRTETGDKLPVLLSKIKIRRPVPRRRITMRSWRWSWAGNGQRGDIKETEDRKKISVLM